MKSKLKIYISGRITGLEYDEAFYNFKVIERRIIKAGFEPVNPMKLVKYDPEKTWWDYMLEDIKLLSGCQAIYMQNNWIFSKGATIEYCIAKETGLIIYAEGDLL